MFYTIQIPHTGIPKVEGPFNEIQDIVAAIHAHEPYYVSQPLDDNGTEIHDSGIWRILDHVNNVIAEQPVNFTDEDFVWHCLRHNNSNGFYFESSDDEDFQDLKAYAEFNGSQGADIAAHMLAEKIAVNKKQQ